MKIALVLTLASMFLSLSPPTAPAQAPSPIDQITTIAANSSCAQVDWNQGGFAPKAYMRGMALVFARAVCQADRADVQVVSSARATPGPETNKTDALTWYEARFAALNMSNATSGVDTLRHAYTLLIGLGMRESSGEFCTGRDQNANFITADSAEAGLFQTSFGARTKHATMAALYEKYKANESGCLLDIFKRGVSCPAHDAENFGTGDGNRWQQLTKTCPAFATEYAAVLMRVHGGRKGEFGPLRDRAAEVRPVCNAMLKQVQDLVRSNPQMCSAL